MKSVQDPTSSARALSVSRQFLLALSMSLLAMASPQLAVAACGDGIVEIGEACDDGNTYDGDCCSATCTVEPSGTICRASIGECDIRETCDGVSPGCPTDRFALDTKVCRPRNGACDIPELCSGHAPDCPYDQLHNAGRRCRRLRGACDVVERCDGTTRACPSDGFLSAGIVCREPAGGCDTAESCSGSAVDCPEDGFRPAGDTCRAAAGECDNAELCNGLSPICTVDLHAPNGEICTDGNPDTGPDICLEGYCGCDGPDLDADGTTDNCDEEDAASTLHHAKISFTFVWKLGSVIARGSFPVGVQGAADIFDPRAGLKVRFRGGANTSDHTVRFTHQECAATRNGYRCRLPSRLGLAIFRHRKGDTGQIERYDFKIKLRNLDITTLLATPVEISVGTGGIDRVASISQCEHKRRRHFICNPLP